MTDQTRLVSLIEVIINTALGFGVSYALWPVVAWLYAIPYSHAMNFSVTCMFTVASLLRGYAVRRFFANKFHEIAVRTARRFTCTNS